MTTQRIEVYKFMMKALRTYGASVVEDRAFPEGRDGLKPVQKRSLQVMYEMGLFPNRGYAKSARIIGDIIGKYHPHAEGPTYNTLVNMAHFRYPLIDGQGNWGDYTSPAAAMRYTEARLTPLAMKNFEAWDVKEVLPNYDGTRDEVLVMPTRLPLCLMNGGQGIGYGVATNVPSHNLEEIVKAAAAIVLNHEISDDDVLDYLLGPDLAFGGVLISDEATVREVYRTGNGSLEYRANYHYEIGDDGVNELVITGFPAASRGSSFKLKLRSNESEIFDKNGKVKNPGFMEKCQDLVKEGLLEYVEDQNPRVGYRIVVGFTNSYPIQAQVLPWLKRSISYQFNVMHQYGEDDVKFFETNPVEMLRDWVEYRKWVEVRLLQYEREQLRATLEKEEARLKITTKLDMLFKILRDVRLTDKRTVIAKVFAITPAMATMVLDSATRTWDVQNQKTIQQHIVELKVDIKDRTKRIAMPGAEVMKQLKELQPFFDDRRTLIREPEPELPGGEVGATGYLGVFANQKGKISTAHSIGDFAVDGIHGFMYVGRDGLATRYNTVPQGRAHHSKTAGLVNLSKPVTVLMGSDGKGGFISTQQRKSNFQTVKVKHGEHLTQVLGMDEGDILWMWDRNRDKIDRLDFVDITTRYAGSSAQTLMKNRTKGIELLVVGQNDDVVLQKSGIKENDDVILLLHGFFTVGDINLVKVGIRRSIKDRTATIKAIKKGTVSQVVKIG